MRNERMRAFWITLLFYALAGPLVGLLCILVTSFFVQAWGPVIDRIGALTPHAPSPPCDLPFDPAHVDLRCFQRFEPRHFRYPWLDRQMLSWGVIGAYMFGFVPALLAGVLVCAGGLRGRGIGFGYAVLVGTLVGMLTGLVTGAMSIYRETSVDFFFLCFIATIVCWFVVKRWWPETEVALANEQP